jgi:hypothetical protein
MPEKSEKCQKIPTDLESTQNGQLIPKISKKWVFWFDKSRKITKNYQKFQSMYKYFIKTTPIPFVH